MLIFQLPNNLRVSVWYVIVKQIALFVLYLVILKCFARELIDSIALYIMEVKGTFCLMQKHCKLGS